MRWITRLGLAALAVGAAVAALGPGSASTQGEADTEIVLCKHSALLLCAPDKIWPSGKAVTGTSKHFAILGELNVLCEDVDIFGLVEPKMAETLTWNIGSAEIGECKGGCFVTVEEIGSSEFNVSAGDKYSLLLKVKIKADCPVDVSCTYSGHAELDIDDPDISGTPLVLAFKEPLTATGGNFCGKTATWDTDIKLKGGSLTVLFSLFQLLA